MRFSRTVRLLKIRRPCGTSATPRAAIISGGSRVTGAPNTSTLPARGGNSPTLTFMQVDLPAPLRPSRPSRRPSPSAKRHLLQHMAVAVIGIDAGETERAIRQDRPPACADRPPLRRGCLRRSPRRNASSVMRSARSSAVSMSCSIITIVTSRGMASKLAHVRRSSIDRPANGSSSSNTFGFCASAMAISTRRLSP
jgi:hypothetical protein